MSSVCDKKFSPNGTWDYEQMIGASVHIKSMSVGKSLFGYDSDSVYKIEDIKFLKGKNNLLQTNIYLYGINEPFSWADLEIIGLDLSCCVCDSSSSKVITNGKVFTNFKDAESKVKVIPSCDDKTAGYYMDNNVLFLVFGDTRFHREIFQFPKDKWVSSQEIYDNAFNRFREFELYKTEKGETHTNLIITESGESKYGPRIYKLTLI